MVRSAPVVPHGLLPGGTIGIVAPASPVAPEILDAALEKLSLWPYRIVTGRYITARRGYLAGTDAERAQDVNDMFANPDVDAIVCLRGGYGTPRMVEHVAFDCVRANPKLFVGYSDITYLHAALHRFGNLVTYHGPMIAELATRSDPLSWHWLFACLQQPHVPVVVQAGADAITLHAGTATGRLVGGNLSLVCSLLGTAYEIDPKDAILLLEDVGEEPYRIDRMLTQLRAAGVLQAAAGIVISDFQQCEAKHPQESLTIIEVLHDLLTPLGIPAVYGMPIGHGIPNLTVPLGAQARLDTTTGTLITL